MKSHFLSALALLSTAGILLAQSVYNGNGSSAWGGAVGQGTLTVSDVGPTLTFTLNRGPGTLDNALVIYIDSTAGGFTDTTAFSDAADGGRSAISGWSGSQRSTLDFASGFQPDYAISIENNFASLFQLNSGGSGSQNWITGVSQSGVNNSSTYSLSFNLSDLGITPGQSFNLFGIEVSSTGFSSPEAMGGTLTGLNGYGNTQSQVGYATFTTVPEPSAIALGCSGLASLYLIRRRR